MIKQIKDITPYSDFLRGFYNDYRFFAQPETEQEVLDKLQKQAEDGENIALAAFNCDRIAGLFTFLYIKEEKYMEMLSGVSLDSAAYGELFSHLRINYPAHEIYFVFNPENKILKSRLRDIGAEFSTEQMKMEHSGVIPQADTVGVELLTPEYYDRYIEMHNKDLYWTGDKVIEAKDKFKTVIIKDGDELAGYTDISQGRAVNGVFDLLVKPEYRRKGYGRKLLVKALQINEPNGMTLEVDIDNTAAIKLYRLTGFRQIEHQNVLTVLLKT